jgi:hypothetical protein
VTVEYEKPELSLDMFLVYSMVLWIDHLSRQTTESDLKIELARFGRPAVSVSLLVLFDFYQSILLKWSSSIS